MSAFPSLPLFTDAFIADTGHLNAQQTGAYLMLLMVAWRSPECRLPDDDDKLARWARVDRRTWSRVKPAVMEFWTLRDGFWTQKRLTQERDIVSKRADAARLNGKHGGRPKSLENNDPDNPTGSDSLTQRKAPNPNPIRSSLRSDHGALSPRDQVVKTPIDPDWQPDARDIDAAITEGVSREAIRREAAQFVDTCLANDTRSADWRASWRRWCRSPYRTADPGSRAPLPGGHRGPPGSSAPTGLAAHIIRNYEQSLTGAFDVEPPSIDANDPDAGASRGSDYGTPWQAGSGGRPADAVLRAAGQGGYDSRASSAIRRRRAG
ncbi:uncharacterized protein YdaU (DUF1376 family) [Methylobacterium sp. RAS18]|nr:uncharacterized protein YdaU (DUF1376 family) [Methylobacterium sp. RAS18]